jgi:3-oxoacyl-[acyl-carrier protein] reductase
MNTESTLGLEGKNAVIFGAGGEIGAEVARQFAAQGARCFLSGRTKSGVQEVADLISKSGGTAMVAEVDALDEDAVNRYVDDVMATCGTIDVAFNATGPQPVEYGNGTDTMKLPVDRFMLPMTTIVRSNFVTARSVARHLIASRSGVILFLTATPSRGVAPGASAIGTAFGAVESLTRCLATELGPFGVRAVCVRSTGMAATRTIQQTSETIAQSLGVPKEKVEEMAVSRTLLRRPLEVAETATLLSFLASDGASAMTGAIVNLSCGQVLD